MDWIERTSDAGASWPADDLRLHRPGSVVALKLVDGQVLAGALRAATADTLELDVDEDEEPLEIDVRSVDAYAVVPEPGD